MSKGWRAFYWEWFWRSFWNPISVAQAIGFLLFIGAGVWTLFFPESAATLNPWLWIIPGIIFVATFSLGLLLAPYTIFRELESQCEDSDSRKAVLIEANLIMQEGQDVIASLAKVREAESAEHKSALNHVDWWYGKAKAFIDREFPESSAWFDNNSGLVEHVNQYPGSHAIAFMNRRLRRLREITAKPNPDG